MSYAASVATVKPLVRGSGPVPANGWFCPVKQCLQGIAK
jgi:hypothetical protein